MGRVCCGSGTRPLASPSAPSAATMVASPDGLQPRRSAPGHRLQDDKEVKLWDAQTGQELLTFRGHSQPLWCVAFSPDGRPHRFGQRRTSVNGSTAK